MLTLKEIQYKLIFTYQEHLTFHLLKVNIRGIKKREHANES